jgi:hypothetical protein
LKKLEETIDAAAVIWKELDVSCTHKARGLFDGHSLEHSKFRKAPNEPNQARPTRKSSSNQPED